MRGRKPKPSALKILEGNPGRRPLNPHEPKPDPGIPPMPDWISSRAKRFWTEYAEMFHKKGLLSHLDQAAFGGLVECLAGIEEANELLVRDGAVILGQSGAPVKHPMANYKKEMLTLLRGYASEFGLSPSSRTRVSIVTDKPENPLRALIAKKR